MKADTDVVTEFNWDHRNRLVGVFQYDEEGEFAGNVSYVYDNAGHRVQKAVRDASFNLTEEEHYTYDGDQVAIVIDGSFSSSGSDLTLGYLQNRYLYAPGVDQVLTDENFGGRGDVGIAAYDLVWAASDALGSVRQLVDDNQNVVEHREFDSFGTITALFDEAGDPKDVDAMDSVFAFAGREWDKDVGLYHNRARWLDSRTGRFISEDPIGFESGETNLYRYAGNDPVNFRDPSGLTQAGNPLVDLFTDNNDEVLAYEFLSYLPQPSILESFDAYVGSLGLPSWNDTSLWLSDESEIYARLASDIPISVLLPFDQLTVESGVDRYSDIGQQIIHQRLANPRSIAQQLQDEVSVAAYLSQNNQFPQPVRRPGIFGVSGGLFVNPGVRVLGEIAKPASDIAIVLVQRELEF